MFLMGMYSQVFAMGTFESLFSPLSPDVAKSSDQGILTMSEVFDQSKDTVLRIKDIPTGNFIIKNLYSQTLKIAK
jgi:hypothetical protein